MALSSHEALLVEVASIVTSTPGLTREGTGVALATPITYRADAQTHLKLYGVAFGDRLILHAKTNAKDSACHKVQPSLVRRGLAAAPRF